MNARLEVRESRPGGPIIVAGYGATFNHRYAVGSFEEVIRPGAFKRTLGENPDVSLLVNHAGLPLARTSSGTMTLAEDNEGLYFSAELEPSDPDVQQLVPKLKRGDMTECSFAFQASQQSWSDDKRERTLHQVSVHKGDVSLVTHAANTSATAGLRAQDLTLEQRERMVERIGNRVCGPYSDPDAASASTKSVRRERGGPSSQVMIARSYLEIARAHRAKGGGGTASRRTPARSSIALARAQKARRDARATLPPHVAPRRYTAAEVAALGKQGKAYKKKNGTYGWPILDEEDLRNAIHAIGRAPAAERLLVKRWIVLSAEWIGRKSLLPSGWWDEVNEATPHGRPTP